MGRWTIRASRWGTLALLFLILAVLPATGPGPAARLAAPTILMGVAADDFEEANGLITAHSAKPAPQLLVLGEVAFGLSRMLVGGPPPTSAELLVTGASGP
jgi:hypothetical protein